MQKDEIQSQKTPVVPKVGYLAIAKWEAAGDLIMLMKVY